MVQKFDILGKISESGSSWGCWPLDDIVKVEKVLDSVCPDDGSSKPYKSSAYRLLPMN